MDQETFNNIWFNVRRETYDRSKGAFKRALWYGNNSALFGQNKGLRKGIRNAPKTIAMGAIGAGIGAAAIPPGASDLIMMAIDAAANKGKDLYSAKIKPLLKNDGPVAFEEGLRKNIKNEVKGLRDNAFQVIDRNLVKMKDAKNKVSPAIQDLMRAQGGGTATSMANGDEARMQKAEAALRAVAEFEYYVDKEIALVTALQDALSQIHQKLDDLKVAGLKTREELSGYIQNTI